MALNNCVYCTVRSVHTFIDKPHREREVREEKDRKSPREKHTERRTESERDREKRIAKGREREEIEPAKRIHILGLW